MSLKRVFIPESDVEVTVIGRLGEVFYWLGAIVSIILLISVFWEPELIISAPIIFLIGRAAMYILSGR